MPKTERRLLIVEDDEAFARTLVRSFERRGYQVRHLTGEDGMPTTQPVGTEEAPWWTGPFVPLLFGILILYFFVFRSKRTQDRQRKDMLAQLQKGDRIQTIGGILGTVIEARESDVLVKVDESSNTKIRFSRNAIHRVIDEDKGEK